MNRKILEKNTEENSFYNNNIFLFYLLKQMARQRWQTTNHNERK